MTEIYDLVIIERAGGRGTAIYESKSYVENSMGGQ